MRLRGLALPACIFLAIVHFSIANKIIGDTDIKNDAQVEPLQNHPFSISLRASSEVATSPAHDRGLFAAFLRDISNTAGIDEQLLGLKIIGRIDRVFTQVSLVFASAEALEKVEALRSNAASNSQLQAVLNKYGLQKIENLAHIRPKFTSKQGIPMGSAMAALGTSFGVALITLIGFLVYYKCCYHRATRGAADQHLEHNHVVLPTKEVDHSETAPTNHAKELAHDDHAAHEDTLRRLHLVCLIFLLVLEIACAACYFLAFPLGLPCIGATIVAIVHYRKSDDEYIELRPEYMYYLWAFHLAFSFLAISGTATILTIGYSHYAYLWILYTAIPVHVVSFVFRFICMWFEHRRQVMAGIQPSKSDGQAVLQQPQLKTARLGTLILTIILGLFLLIGLIVEIVLLSMVLDADARCRSSTYNHSCGYSYFMSLFWLGLGTFLAFSTWFGFQLASVVMPHRLELSLAVCWGTGCLIVGEIGGLNYLWALASFPSITFCLVQTLLQIIWLGFFGYRHHQMRKLWHPLIQMHDHELHELPQQQEEIPSNLFKVPEMVTKM